MEQISHTEYGDNLMAQLQTMNPYDGSLDATGKDVIEEILHCYMHGMSEMEISDYVQLGPVEVKEILDTYIQYL
jgi:hypothetical protein